jgi:dynein heavy chain
MKAVKFPSQGTIFDYYLDHKTKKFLPWADKVPQFTMDPDVPLQVGVWNSKSVATCVLIQALLKRSLPFFLAR